MISSDSDESVSEEHERVEVDGQALLLLLERRRRNRELSADGMAASISPSGTPRVTQEYHYQTTYGPLVHYSHTERTPLSVNGTKKEYLCDLHGEKDFRGRVLSLCSSLKSTATSGPDLEGGLSLSVNSMIVSGPRSGSEIGVEEKQQQTKIPWLTLFIDPEFLTVWFAFFVR